MSLVDQFKKRVEQYWDHLKLHDPYNRAILDGTATQEMVTHFLTNIRYLVQHTPIHLNQAIQEAEQRDQKKLAEFFRHKYEEERDHDKWADSDIAQLNQKWPQPHLNLAIDPTMLNLVKHIENTISEDPYLYLGYIFFAEYLCVVGGPEMIEGLEKKCGFPPQSMTIVANHAELDKEHVDEWIQITRDLVDEAKYEKALLESLEKTIKIHQEFFQSCRSKNIKCGSSKILEMGLNLS